MPLPKTLKLTPKPKPSTKVPTEGLPDWNTDRSGYQREYHARRRLVKAEEKLQKELAGEGSPSSTPAAPITPPIEGLSSSDKPKDKYGFTDEDYQKLADKNWRMNHLYKITNKDAQLIIFSPNQAQRHFQRNRCGRDIILKSRQLGFTTFASVDMLDDVLWNKHFHALLVAQEDVHALNIFDGKINLAWEHFPLKHLFTVDADRANKLKLNFGQGEFSEISVKSSGRSDTLQRVHVSEFAKICIKYPHKAKEIITGTFNAVPLSTGQITIESTAEGDSGDFHDMFWDAYNRPEGVPRRPTEFKAHFYNWQWDLEEIRKIHTPDAQIPNDFKDYQRKHNEKAAKDPDKFKPINDIQLTYWFYKWLQNKKDWKKLFQEYPVTPEEAFVSSGAKVFDFQKLERQNPNLLPGQQVGSWTYYIPYQPGHTYALAGDPAFGVHRHHAGAAIWDFTPDKPTLVATYSNDQVEPDMFAFELKAGAQAYGNCLIAVERNNPGHATLTKLKEIYPLDLIYKDIKQESVFDKETQRLGFDMNLASKPKIVYDMVTAVHEELVLIPSKQVLHEFRIYNRQDVQTIYNDEESTRHLDLATAVMIGFFLRNHVLILAPTVEVYSPHAQRKDGRHDAI